MKKTKMFPMRLTQTQFQQAKSTARRRQVSVASLIRFLLKKAYESHSTNWEKIDSLIDKQREEKQC